MSQGERSAGSSIRTRVAVLFRDAPVLASSLSQVSGCARLAQGYPRANMDPESSRLLKAVPPVLVTLEARGGFRYAWVRARDVAVGKALSVADRAVVYPVKGRRSLSAGLAIDTRSVRS